MSAFALLAPQVAEYSGIFLKLVINGFAYPLVICSETPKNIEKIKKIANFLSLNKLNAFSPNASYKVRFSPELVTATFGSVNEYKKSKIPKTPETKNWL